MEPRKLGHLVPLSGSLCNLLVPLHSCRPDHGCCHSRSRDAHVLDNRPTNTQETLSRRDANKHRRGAQHRRTPMNSNATNLGVKRACVPGLRIKRAHTAMLRDEVYELAP